jgi:hypothetical protein
MKKWGDGVSWCKVLSWAGRLVNGDSSLTKDETSGAENSKAGASVAGRELSRRAHEPPNNTTSRSKMKLYRDATSL